MYAITPATVDCHYFGADFIIEITENGKMVNKYIVSPGPNGLIESIRISGINLGLFEARYNREHKVLWFDADDIEKDGWGEYIEFTIVQED